MAENGVQDDSSELLKRGIVLPSVKRVTFKEGYTPLSPFVNKKGLDKLAREVQDIKDSGGRAVTFGVHPRKLADAGNCSNIPGLGQLLSIVSNENQQQLKNRFLYMPLAQEPAFFIRNGDMKIGGYSTKGFLQAVLIFGEQIATQNGWSDISTQKIINGIQLAERVGMSHYGLGALLSPATGGGMLVEREQRRGNLKTIGITNGNAYTAGITLRSVQEWTTNLCKKAEDTKVMVVGATGSVGTAVSQLLLEEGYPTPILNGRSADTAISHFRKYGIGPLDAEFSGNINDLHKADIVVMTTSAVYSLVDEDSFTPGTAIIDITQPQVIDPRVESLLRRSRSVVIEGGLASIPNFHLKFPLEFPNGQVFACAAETLLLGLKGIKGNWALGKIEGKLARKTLALGDEFGFTLASPSWNGRQITREDITRMRVANQSRGCDSTFSIKSPD